MAGTVGVKTRYLKSAYLADTEGLLRETRGTILYYLPKPLFFVLLTGIVDYGAASAHYPNRLPAIPYLTQFFTTYAANFHSIGRDVIWEVFFGILFLLALLWLLIRYLHWISTVYAVTTHRVIIQRGILGRDLDEIPIPQIRGVDVRQTIVQRILHYGTIKVSSEGGLSSVGNEDWVGIPRPFEFQRLVESASQAIARGAYNTPTTANPAYPAAGLNLPPKP